MLISDLQNQLRALVSERIAAGELTGTELARRAGFQQAHISNFLKGRRGFSIETMDRVMEVMRLQVRDLMPQPRIRRIAAETGESGYESVPLVKPSALLHREFTSNEIEEQFPLKKSLLRRMRSDMASERTGWRRFVLMKADKESGAAMHPRLAAGAVLLIDRHYNSLLNYRRGEPNIYVVSRGAAWPVRYVELQGSQLTLRPQNPETALGFVRPGKGETFADYLVGRVAHIMVET
jgi:transcriptional regulator with XRE-family HTH domain